jgi:transposase-like protein
MLARGLSVRDIEDAFKDENGRLLLSKTAVSQLGERLWEDYQAFAQRDLSEYENRRGSRTADDENTVLVVI